MDNKEMEKLDLEEPDPVAGGADTPEQLAYWEFRDKMLKKYGSIVGITDMKDMNILQYKKKKAEDSYTFPLYDVQFFDKKANRDLWGFRDEEVCNAGHYVGCI